MCDVAIERPPVVWADGTQKWFKDNYVHRDNGPAIIYANGRQEWFYYSKRHRTDGPAVIDPDGHCQWWFNNVRCTFELWCKQFNISNKQKTVLMLKYDIHT